MAHRSSVIPVELLGHGHRWPVERCGGLGSIITSVINIEIDHGLRSEPDDRSGGVPTRWSPSWSPSVASTTDTLDIPGFLQREVLAAEKVKTSDRTAA